MINLGMGWDKALLLFFYGFSPGLMYSHGLRYPRQLNWLITTLLITRKLIPKLISDFRLGNGREFLGIEAI